MWIKNDHVTLPLEVYHSYDTLFTFTLFSCLKHGTSLLSVHVDIVLTIFIMEGHSSSFVISDIGIILIDVCGNLLIRIPDTTCHHKSRL